MLGHPSANRRIKGGVTRHGGLYTCYCFTVNVAGGDVPPVVLTVTLFVPAFAIWLAGTAAFSLVILTKVVVSAVAPHFASASGTKFVPLIVRVNAAPPAVAELGLRLEMVGVKPAWVTGTLTVPIVSVPLRLDDPLFGAMEYDTYEPSGVAVSQL